jgi:hypothetical protein
VFNASITLAKVRANVQMEDMRRKSDEAQMSAFLETVHALETQRYGPRTATVERQKAAAAAERLLRKPEKEHQPPRA